MNGYLVPVKVFYTGCHNDDAWYYNEKQVDMCPPPTFAGSLKGQRLLEVTFFFIVGLWGKEVQPTWVVPPSL